MGTSLAVQWLILYTVTARVACKNPDWGTKIPHVIPCSEIKKKKNLWLINLQQRRQDYRGKTVASIKGAEKATCRKMKLEYSLIPYTKNKLIMNG